MSQNISKGKRVKPHPSKLRIRELFRYKSGALIWKERPVCEFSSPGSASSWNSKNANKIAGNIDLTDCYVRIKIDGILYKAHRLIWIWHYGDIPEGMEIDHKNGVRSYNKIKNLTLTNENEKNAKRYKSNTSGACGVYFRRESKKWRAIVNNKGKTISLGSFDNFSDAESAVKEKRKQLGFSERHGT